MNPQTHFEIDVVLGTTIPKDVSKLLVLICCNQPPALEFILSHFKLPAHPFFGLADWQTLFQYSHVQFRRMADDSYELKAIGRTDLEEQDVGLFIRWLHEYLSRTGVFISPQYLAYVRSEIRPPNRQWLTYSIDQASLDDKLRVSFLTRDNLLG